jgi:uncharacterized SAM-binding protein YcdF (DUF218 family)
MPALPGPAEAIVVLGGGVNDQGVLGERSLRRTPHDITLDREGFAPWRPLLGVVNNQGAMEAGIRAAMACQLGIIPTATLTETIAHTTREEAARMVGLLQPMGVRRILLLNESEHMVRVRLLFAHVGFTIHPTLVDELSQPAGSKASLQLTRKVMQEILVRFYHRLAGYL